MSIGDRIKQRRLEIGLTVDQVAEQIGKNRATVYRYESSEIEKFPIDILAPLAQALRTTPAYLMGWESERSSQFAHSDFMSPYNPTRRIPILGRISAGLPLYAEEHIEGYTYTELNGGAEYFALRVTGDSMTAARIHDGDTLIVRRQDIVENGQIAVVIVGDDEATVKRFYKNGNSVTLMPQSTNPVHQPQIYDTSATHIRVIGLVVKNEITF